MSKPLFKAKILKPVFIHIGGKEHLPGDIVEVDNNTLAALILRGEAKFHEDTPAKPEKADGGSSITVAELKATLDELGIQYGANMKKAELQALLDADREDAEPDGEDNLLG